jgi:CDP-diacylglycerol--serine O-phosphatidyltransferase
MNDQQQIKRKRRHLRDITVLPVLITLLNAMCGFAAIHFAARGMDKPNLLWLEKPELTFFAAAAWMIFFAMIADGFDGFVARRSGNESEFGGHLDSLSDAISFGVAPAFLMLRVVENHLRTVDRGIDASPFFGDLPGRLLWLVAALYVCCAVMRLARFNVENSPEEKSHINFSGLPSPAAAGVIAALVLLHSDLGHELRGIAVVSNSIRVVIYLLPFVTVGVALLMVSRISYVHVVNRYVRGRKSFGYVVMLLLLLLALIWKLQLTLTIGGLIYAFSGPARRLWRKHIRKSETEIDSPQPPDD